MRKSRQLISAGVVVLLATAGLASAPASASPASASPESVAVQLAVSPSTELTNGQTVTVTASGLVPGDAVWPVEDCASYCQRHLTPSTVADASGRATFVVPVERYLWDSLFGVWSDPPLDCAYVTSCRIRLAHHDDSHDEGYAFVASQPITFVRAVATSPTVTVAAPQPLPADITTDIRGQGFDPGTAVFAARCFARSTSQGSGEHCDPETQGVADGSGRATISLELRQRTLTGDCLDPATMCTVRMWGGAAIPPVAVTVPITFDPNDTPPPPPVIEVTPTTDLGVAGTVSVHGAGFRPGRSVFLNQCITAGGGSIPCALDAMFAATGVVTQSRADGTFDASLPVQRYIPQILEPVVDCVTPPGCHVVASEDQDNPAAAVPLTFATVTSDPVLTFEGVTVLEGTSAGPTVARAHVHLDHASTAPVRFRWYPESYADLFGDVGVMEIPPGQTEADFPVSVRADSMHEPDETARLIVMAMEGAQINPATPALPVRIIDDDPVPRVSVDDTIVMENDPSGQATVHLHLSNPTQDRVRVRYRTRHGTAHKHRDYEGLKRVEVLGSGSGDGSSDRYFHVPLIDDHRRERLEYFDLELVDAHNARIAHGRARIWIVDND